MTETRSRMGSVRRTASSIGSRAVEAASTVALVGALLGWSLFWSNLARVHYSQGDLASALFTAAVFVGPAIYGLGWYVGESMGVDVPAPSIDTSVTSS